MSLGRAGIRTGSAARHQEPESEAKPESQSESESITAWPDCCAQVWVGACSLMRRRYLEAGRLAAVHAAEGDEGVAGVLRKLHHLRRTLSEVHHQRDPSLHAVPVVSRVDRLQEGVRAQSGQMPRTSLTHKARGKLLLRAGSHSCPEGGSRGHGNCSGLRDAAAAWDRPGKIRGGPESEPASSLGVQCPGKAEVARCWAAACPEGLTGSRLRPCAADA